ncbi:conserved hypothetical protein [Theileria orientalis strain Shintoku]|uniref:Uncharacterized protein n=1 Tax=Theileria orientalis strain Shintoku TaxID=869250 RepID=J4C990_THEOR|nr:conserved hypothetical protein [Theileria orientalis strain Shintoku]BAM42123.1 conserved hypothetical protein [Theileria orientalis strain Shintoku]|eukprot:XP_009692424.1 conserved hypothetical protein [Theileria orientalis strain Shintoku]
MFNSKSLLSYNKYRQWERSLRRFNARKRWNLVSWLTKGTYENLKFKNGWKTTSHVNAPRAVESTDKATKHCDMERLHEQDREYYRNLTR